eukprot:NODE_1116_length_2138_cov_0.027464.p3 type:complete len:118 gc:universal NODE_1116_length_2138_cov_0.027464:1155-1508(+)
MSTSITDVNSNSHCQALRRPETEFARQRRQVDPNPRYCSENVLRQELDPPERTTQPYEGPGMASRVAPVLAMPLDADEEEVTFTVAQEAVPQPYLHYENGDAGACVRMYVRHNCDDR